jgi:hypothetical protein
MSVLQQLASALDRRDEVPNQELAVRIANRRDTGAVGELVQNLANRNAAIRSDCIKVLYEIGKRDADLISPHCDAFANLIAGKDNRLAWGAMTALDCIASVRPKQVYAMLERIVAAADAGSVITRDHAVGIMVKLAAHKPYAKKCRRLLLEHLKSAPNNQTPMYAENCLTTFLAADTDAFRRVLARRMNRLEKESQKKRVAKVLGKLHR